MLVVISLIILAGCIESKIDVPISEYDELPAEGGSAGGSSASDQDEVTKPHSVIDIYSESSIGAGGVINGYCWNKSADECTLTPENPAERTKNETALLVDKGEEIELFTTHSLEDSLAPHRVENFQYGFSDTEGKVVDSVMDGRDVTFFAPEESGSYFYLVHVIWDEAVTKQVYYAFRMVVR